MGSLTYDGVVVQFDDRILTHLQIVIVQKLRRGESFLLSWKDSLEVGGGRSSAWLHPANPLYFKFSGSRHPTINRDWLAELTTSANSSRGLVVTGEPDLVAGDVDATTIEARASTRSEHPIYTVADGK